MLRRRSSTLSPLRQNCLSAKLAASSVAAGPFSNTLLEEKPYNLMMFEYTNGFDLHLWLLFFLMKLNNKIPPLMFCCSQKMSHPHLGAKIHIGIEINI